MRTGRLVGLMAAALAVGGCGSMGGAAAAGPCTAATATAVTGAIEIAATAYVPSCAKVAAGTTVTFTNDDASQHTVTTDPGQVDAFDSGLLDQGGKFVHTFGTAGTELIHCNVHPGMHLTVLVQ